MCGVRVVLSGRLFQNSIALVVIMGLLLRMLTFLTRGFIRIFYFLGMSKIENWNIYTLFWILLSLCFLMLRDRKNFVGNQQRIRVLKWVSTTSFPQLLTRPMFCCCGVSAFKFNAANCLLCMLWILVHFWDNNLIITLCVCVCVVGGGRILVFETAHKIHVLLL